MSAIAESKQSSTTVSYIIRCTDGNFDKLELSIFSIYCGTYSDKEVVVVYHGKNNNYAEELASLTQAYPELNLKVLMNQAEVRDAGKNANLGIRACSGRYFCVMTEGDFLAPEHASIIIASMSAGAKAWGYGQSCFDLVKDGIIVSKEHPFWHDKYSYLRLWKQNYISTSSIIIDHTMIAEMGEKVFPEQLGYFSDWALLLRLGLNHAPVCIARDVHYVQAKFGEDFSRYSVITDERFVNYRHNLQTSLYWMNELIYPGVYSVYEPRLLRYLKSRVMQSGIIRYVIWRAKNIYRKIFRREK